MAKAKNYRYKKKSRSKALHKTAKQSKRVTRYQNKPLRSSLRLPVSGLSRFGWIVLLLLVLLAAYSIGRWAPWSKPKPAATVTVVPISTPKPKAKPAALEPGQVVAVSAPQVLTKIDVASQVRWRYGASSMAPAYDVAWRLVEYTSTDANGKILYEYARVYVPLGVKDIPVVTVAPGTTGLADACAASLEDPVKRNLGDYQAQALAIADQGDIVVVPDYEGMRDVYRLHHYMIGQLEGRSVLDAVRASSHTAEAVVASNGHVYLGGYSQGGQAAGWADKLAPSYAPSLKIKGFIAYAPVSDVQQTLAGVLHGSTADWFGPYVLDSYSDYYGDVQNIDQILLPKWSASLAANVASTCIDSAPHFWGSSPAAIYTPQFLAALGGNQLAASGYSTLANEMAENTILDLSTKTPKLLLQGGKDDVILPAQTDAFKVALCQNQAGPVQLVTFPNSSHYSIPGDALSTALGWIKSIEQGKQPASDCT